MRASQTLSIAGLLLSGTIALPLPAQATTPTAGKTLNQVDGLVQTITNINLDNHDPTSADTISILHTKDARSIMQITNSTPSSATVVVATENSADNATATDNDAASLYQQQATAIFLSQLPPIEVARRNAILGGVFGSIILIAIFAMATVSMLCQRAGGFRSGSQSAWWRRRSVTLGLGSRWRKGKQRERLQG